MSKTILICQSVFSVLWMATGIQILDPIEAIYNCCETLSNQEEITKGGQKERGNFKTYNVIIYSPKYGLISYVNGLQNWLQHKNCEIELRTGTASKLFFLYHSSLDSWKHRSKLKHPTHHFLTHWNNKNKKCSLVSDALDSFQKQRSYTVPFWAWQLQPLNHGSGWSNEKLPRQDLK